MFKGYTNELKEKIEQYNQNSENLIFCISDLEYSSDRKQGEHKFDIHSEELKQKLGNIIVSNNGKISSPRGIRFLELPSRLKHGGTRNYNSWIKVNKKYLLELNKSNSSRIIELRNEVYNSWESLQERLQPGREPKFEVCNVFRLARELNFDYWAMHQIEREENKEIEKHNRIIFKARDEALQEINQTLSGCSMDIGTAEIYWTTILPEWCSCEVKGTGHPDNNTLHQRHIQKCLWREESEIKAFKDKMLTTIREGKERFDNYKNQVIQQIINKANQQGISEAELNNNRPNWQNHLHSLTNKEKIADYQTKYLEKDIQNLASTKNKSDQERQQAETDTKEKAKKEEERLKKEQEEKERKEAEEKKKEEQETKKQAEEQAKQQKLNQQKDKSINEIITALNQEPKLTNGELSPQYQNWEEQINQLSDIQQITNFQDRILADIQARRHDKKTAEEVKENLKKAQTGTKEEKEKAWENLEKQETEKGYQDNKEEVEKLKKDKATENPQEYGKEAQKKIEEKLKNNGVKEDELSDENKKEWQKLKNGEIKDPNQLVAAETKIKENIYQKEAEEKLVDLTSQVNKILKLKDKSQIATVKKLLLEFISSSNIYYTSSQKKAAENLLTRLENCSFKSKNDNLTNNNLSRPIKIVIVAGVSLVVIGMITLLVVRKKGRIKRPVKN